MAAGLITALAPAASAADSTTYLEGVTNVSDVAAGDGKVFVAARDRIVVADTDGTVIGAVTGLSGADGLALAPDGSRLFAALSGSNQVAEINVTDLTVTRRIDLASYPCPTHLSLSGDRLWVGYGCTFGGVLSLDVSTATPQPTRIVSDMYRAPLVAAAGDTVVLGESGISPSDLLVFDVSTTPPAQRGVIEDDPYSANLEDLAITPDGSTVISAFGAARWYAAWDTTSLAKVRTYGMETGPEFSGYPIALAISPDGSQVVGGRMAGPDVALYDAATTKKTYTDDYPVGELVPRTLAFLGSDVFGVLKEQSTGRFSLWRLESATLPASAVSLTAPPSATALEPLTVTGTLTLSGGTAPGAQPLVVTRKLPDGTSTTLPSVTTAADGTFTITDTPPTGGTTAYAVLWDGNPEFRWSTASVTLTVAKHATSLTLSGPQNGRVGRQLVLSGALDIGGHPPAPRSYVKLVRTITNDSGTTTVSRLVSLATDGSFSTADTLRVSGQYAYTVEWAGDGATLPSQATYTVTVKD
ncbi:hypothetical protein [Streptosporangium canum]|uniref:hypothetical protein n=1 Tax=Streptosporangium canum TaxID=324952 RepID=UPI0037B9E806